MIETPAPARSDSFRPVLGLSLLLFIAISLSSMIIPVVRYALAPAKTASQLAGWKAWLARHSGQILTYLLVGYGSLICVNAVSALT